MMRRLIIILTSFTFLTTSLGISPAVADTLFSCGSGTYNVTSSGVLTGGSCDANLLVLDSSVTSIQYASMQGWRIKSLTIPASVTTIGNSAFYALPDLETITVNASNTNFKTVDGVLMNFAESRILHYPGASRSTTYTVPGTVTSIDDRSFNCLSYLQVVNIPAGVTTIGPSAFETCGYPFFPPSLKEINVSPSNTQFTSIDNVLFSKNGTILLNFPGNYAQLDYAVPAGTTEIAASAFSYTKIRSVTFPNTLVTIKQYAFAYTPDLISVGQFPASYKYSYGNWSPFIGAVKVENFSVASANTDFTSVDGVIFSKDGLTLYEYPGGRTATTYRIPDSVTAVDQQAFANQYLKTLTVPSTLQTLGYSYLSLDYLAFAGTSSVATIQGFGSVQSLVYCGTTNSVINTFASSIAKTVECLAGFFSSIPGAPTIGIATALSPTSASITFTAPASNGGATIETYTATSSPGSITGQVLQSGSGTITVTGLTPSTSYTFSVTASNNVGTSSASNSTVSLTTPASAEEIAAQIAAAIAKREAEKRNARAEIISRYKKSEKASVELFALAEIPGITKENIGALEVEIFAYSEELRADITQVLKSSRKYEVVGIMASDRFVTCYSNSLIEIGLIHEDSKHKEALTAAIKKLPASERSSYAAIKEAIDNEIAEIQARKDRLANVLALIASRNG